MSFARSPSKSFLKPALIVAGVALIFLIVLLAFWRVRPSGTTRQIEFASTLTGPNGEFGEPFGIAVKDGRIYVSDGEKNEIRVIDGTTVNAFASGLNTPSAIAFNKKGDLVVADTGSHTIKSIDEKGGVTIIAGIENKAGFTDGDATSALFRAPIGIAVDSEDRIFVADTYNDRIRIIENGKVRTLAGNTPGFADGVAEQARFYTPTGIAMWNDKLLVADTQNHRIRVVEQDGSVWTLAGDGGSDVKDGLLLSAALYQPTGITVTANNEIYFTDGNAIRKIGGSPIPSVTTVSSQRRGFADGAVRKSRFNRPSSIAFGGEKLYITDSDNRIVRVLAADKGEQATKEQIVAMQETPEKFRDLAPPRWPYDPPDTPRDIAGTFGELRGEIKDGNDDIHFHNGLDIAGSCGETARFIRTEKVLDPVATDNFNTLRELIRMPMLGYIHLRLGRDQTSKPFGDERFLFTRDDTGKVVDVRLPRGAYFKAGEPIGTLNPMNHVHLVAGRSGFEMNAIDALTFPGIADSRPPTIEKAWLADANWRPLETKDTAGRIEISGKIRVIARSFDQMNGNSERRRLGLYRAGYQLLNGDNTPAGDEQWNIVFERLSDAAAVPLVYAEGSYSGASGTTTFDLIVTNKVNGDDYREEFLDTATLAPGKYVIRVLVGDYFGNKTHSDIPVAINR